MHDNYRVFRNGSVNYLTHFRKICRVPETSGVAGYLAVEAGTIAAIKKQLGIE
jgi:hypothetical protein